MVRNGEPVEPFTLILFFSRNLSTNKYFNADNSRVSGKLVPAEAGGRNPILCFWIPGQARNDKKVKVILI